MLAFIFKKKLGCNSIPFSREWLFCIFVPEGWTFYEVHIVIVNRYNKQSLFQKLKGCFFCALLLLRLLCLNLIEMDDTRHNATNDKNNYYLVVS